MSPARSLKRFFLLAALYYALSMAAWPVVRSAYLATFRACGAAVFSRFGSEGMVRFLDPQHLSPADYRGRNTPPAVTGEKDTVLELVSAASPESFGYFRTSGRYMAYIPAAVFLAFALATPIPWKRRAWMIVWGLFLVHLFILCRLGTTLLQQFSGAKAYALFHPSPFQKAIVDAAQGVLADAPTVAYVAPVAVWVAVNLGYLRRTWFSDEDGEAGRPARTESHV